MHKAYYTQDSRAKLAQHVEALCKPERGRLAAIIYEALHHQEGTPRLQGGVRLAQQLQLARQAPGTEVGEGIGWETVRGDCSGRSSTGTSCYMAAWQR